jgi:hypothetical protein
MLVALAAVVATVPRLRRLESDLPDATPDATPDTADPFPDGEPAETTVAR